MISQINDGQNYIYNYATDSFDVENMVMKNIDRSEAVWRDKELAYCTEGMVLSSEDKDDLEIDEPRSDGKFACSILKKMRKGLVKAKGLVVEIKECNYDGPCSGTCPQCEREMREIEIQMAAIPEKLRIYPGYDIEDEVSKSGKVRTDCDE